MPVYFPKAGILDLPLLITIYFGLSRRNPSTGLLLGMTIGILQDSLSGPTVPLGLYGIAKTVIGYLASSIGARLDTEHPAARFALTAAFFVVHQGIVALTQRLLLSQPEPLVHHASWRQRRSSTLSSPCFSSCSSTACAESS